MKRDTLLSSSLQLSGRGDAEVFVRIPDRGQNPNRERTRVVPECSDQVPHSLVLVSLFSQAPKASGPQSSWEPSDSFGVPVSPPPSVSSLLTSPAAVRRGVPGDG